MDDGDFLPLNHSPLPYHITHLLSKDVANMLMKAKTKIEFGDLPSHRKDHTIYLKTPDHYGEFIGEVGRLLWDHHFTSEDRNAYAKLVGAVNANKLTRSSGELSTKNHFIANFERLMTFRPGYVLRAPLSNDHFLSFFKTNGLITPIHYFHLLENSNVPPFEIKPRDHQNVSIPTGNLDYSTVATAFKIYSSYQNPIPLPAKIIPKKK
jgi:hypothetical protein